MTRAGWLTGLGVGVALGLGLACEVDEDCDPGAEGCRCAAAGACLTGLVCLSDYCVDPDWTPTGGAEDNADGADGPAAFDNVRACDELVDELSCGSVDVGMYVDCSLYADLPCDIADYFDCARENISCTGGMLDAAKLVECAMLALCE